MQISKPVLAIFNCR